MYTYVHTYIYMYKYMYMYIYLHTHTYMCVFVYLQVCVCTCVCVCARECKFVLKHMNRYMIMYLHHPGPFWKVLSTGVHVWCCRRESHGIWELSKGSVCRRITSIWHGRGPRRGKNVVAVDCARKDHKGTSAHPCPPQFVVQTRLLPSLPRLVHLVISRVGVGYLSRHVFSVIKTIGVLTRAFGARINTSLYLAESLFSSPRSLSCSELKS